MIASGIIIYTSATCGWALRNYALLFEKGIPFTAVDVKDGKEEDHHEFLSVFPYGLTPGLRHGNTLVWESQRINDYLDDVYPAQPLLPATAAERALARQWLHHSDHNLFPTLYRALRDPSEGAALQRGIDQLSHPAFGKVRPAPYWSGEKIGMVDINYQLIFNSLRVSPQLAIKLPEWMQDWSITIANAPSIVRAEEFMASLKGRQSE